MRIVIEISEDRYKQVCEEQWLPNRLYFEKAIANGTPLPKGHGALKDTDALCNHFWDNRSKLYTYKDLQIVIDRAPTIIEADKEGET